MEPREKEWTATLDRVKAFMLGHGRTPRATCADENEAFLGEWCVRQRMKHKRRLLSPQRVALAESNGIFSPSNDPEFFEKLEACAAFIETHGRPPSSVATDPREKSLYYWRADQQHLRSIGRLKPYRLQLLTEKGIFRTAYEREWQSAFNDLKAFVETHGRPPIRRSANPEESRLGKWRQRQFELYKTGKLDSGRAKSLESVGAATTVTDFNWNRTFRRLQALVAKRKSPPNYASKKESERRLAEWLHTQKSRINSGELSSRRKKLIESLDMPESRLESRWEKMLARVKSFVKKRKRLPSTNADDPEERFLAGWCSRQRTAYKAGKQKESRKEHIENLGLLRNRKREQWKIRYKQVYQFIRTRGAEPNRRVADSFERMLGRWCDHQRYLYSLNKLAKDRLVLLRAAGVLREPTRGTS